MSVSWEISLLSNRNIWCCRLGIEADNSASREKGISQMAEVSRTFAEQAWASVSIASSPMISPGRWKPRTCSPPSGLGAKVLMEPVLTTYRERKRSPVRNRGSPRGAGGACA